MLRGCSWVRAHERVRDDGIVRYAASIVCRIPADPDYLSPGAWDALDAPEGTFTLAAGTYSSTARGGRDHGGLFRRGAAEKVRARRGHGGAERQGEHGALRPCALRGALLVGQRRAARPPALSERRERYALYLRPRWRGHKKSTARRCKTPTSGRARRASGTSSTRLCADGHGQASARRALRPGHHRTPAPPTPAASTTARGSIFAATGTRWPPRTGTGLRKRRAGMNFCAACRPLWTRATCAPAR